MLHVNFCAVVKTGVVSLSSTYGIKIVKLRLCHAKTMKAAICHIFCLEYSKNGLK